MSTFAFDLEDEADHVVLVITKEQAGYIKRLVGDCTAGCAETYNLWEALGDYLCAPVKLIDASTNKEIKCIKIEDR